jgi:hypothetical protein
VSVVDRLRAPCAAGHRASWERTAWEHPEWWTIALSALAWLAIVARVVSLDGGAGLHGSHAAAETVEHASIASVIIGGSLDWLLMVIAMMLPLVTDAVRTTATRSLWARRHRAIGMFILGYITPWMIAGCAIIALAGAATSLGPPRSWLWVIGGFAAAAFWQLAPVKLRALRSCHRTMPLAPRGWRADRDCLRYGWTIGGRCAISCWAMMMACVLAVHSIPAMLCASAVATAERTVPRLDRRVTAGVLLGGGAVSGMLLF